MSTTENQIYQISFAIEENIWGPIFLVTNTIHRKDLQKAKFYWLQKNKHTNPH